MCYVVPQKLCRLFSILGLLSELSLAQRHLGSAQQAPAAQIERPAEKSENYTIKFLPYHSAMPSESRMMVRASCSPQTTFRRQPFLL